MTPSIILQYISDVCIFIGTAALIGLFGVLWYHMYKLSKSIQKTLKEYREHGNH